MAVFGHEIVYFRFDLKFVFVSFCILKHVFRYGSFRPRNSLFSIFDFKFVFVLFSILKHVLLFYLKKFFKSKFSLWQLSATIVHRIPAKFI